MEAMPSKSKLAAVLLLPFMACSGDDSRLQPEPVPTAIASNGGTDQSSTPGSALALPLSVLVTDASGNPVAGVEVTWSVLTGGGTVSPALSTTTADGVTTTTFILGPAEGKQRVQAGANQLQGSPVVFTATATAVPPPPQGVKLTVAGGGNNVPD